ncbi:MAG: M28 family peptidase [Verrucomicrobiota bacterium]
MRRKIFSLFTWGALLVLSACGRPAASPRYTPSTELWNDFSGDKAFEHVKQMIDLGPRPIGSPELEKSREYIIRNLEKSGWQVERQKFSDNTPRGKFEFVNLIARFPVKPGKPVPADAQQVIVCSHYDTKIFDTVRFVGASDGASSSGALIELARVLARDPQLASKIELVFFDGEEAVQSFTETDGLYGSRYYARNLRETKRAGQFKFGILWDMIGDKNLTITLPPDSPPRLARGIFEAADALKVRENFSYFGNPVLDDHTPLNSSFIPTIDLIDFDYPPWHTPEDTLDKLSPDSLRKVGAVTLFFLQHELAK